MYYLFSYLISRQDSQGDQSLTDGTSLKYKNYLSRPEAQSRVQLFTMSMTTHAQPPPHTCKKGGSGVLNDFFCHSSPIRELESDCRKSLSTRSSIPAVQCTCTGNAIITFFTPFNPTPCDKKCCSEHQTLFPLLGGGVWRRD